MADRPPARCQAVTRGGKPCGATPVPEDDRCPWHSPLWEEKRREWSRKGGANKSNAARARKAIAPAMTAVELEGILSAVLKGTLGGKVEPNVATACANVARTMIEVAKVGRLERQIAELERGERAS